MRFSIYVFRSFLPAFLVSLGFFIFILSLIDIFANIFDFLRTNLPFLQIGELTLLFVPRAFVLGLPLSMVFAASFTIAKLSNNFELLAAHALGISLFKSVRLVVIFAASIGLIGFSVQEFIAIPSLKEKAEKSSTYLNRPSAKVNRAASITDRRTGIVYKFGQYQRDQGLIVELEIVKVDKDGNIRELFVADRAHWDGKLWQMEQVRVIKEVQGQVNIDYFPGYSDPETNLDPVAFEGPEDAFDTLTWREAVQKIEQKIATGSNIDKEEGKLSERVSFAVTPLVVTLLAIVVGRRAKKLLVLISLSMSLGLAIVYYVSQILTVQLGNYGILPPLISAWIPVLLFGGLGSYMLYRTESRR